VHYWLIIELLVESHDLTGDSEVSPGLFKIFFIVLNNPYVDLSYFGLIVRDCIALLHEQCSNL